MTLEQVNLVKESFWKILPIAGVAADLFYDRLFEIAPEVRPLFPDDLVAQKKKLMAMLAVAVTNLHQVDKIAPAVEDLGRRHKAYGVTAKHFEPVGAALLWTLEEGLGAEFTPPVKAAWTEAYKILAGVMKRVAATGSDQRSGTGSDRLRATTRQHALVCFICWTRTVLVSLIGGMSRHSHGRFLAASFR